MTGSIEPLTEDDLLALGLQARGQFAGYVGRRNGAIAAWGGAFWTDEYPAAFVTFEARSVNVRGVMLGVCAKRLFKELDRRGVTERFTFCDDRVPNVRRWLEWLSFHPTNEVDGGHRIWRWKP